jgi:hypothetical protein
MTLCGSLVAVFKLVAKLNRTLTSLEDAVQNLNESVRTQSEKNRIFYEKIGDHETRLCLLEVGEGRKESGNGN